SARIGRSEKSCEYRMQNISHVLALMGRDWIPGLPPAKNVGVRVTEQIETLICELEGRRESARATEAATVAKLRKTLKQRPAGSKTPQKTTSTTTSVVRDPQVKAWVLERANGTCEACGQPAPFIGADGFPFLEVHHLRRLADDGSDTPTNAVAVCPNCHRRLHFSENARAYRETLFGKVAELVRE
ncbi:HNH endonuclease, partial [Burkholderia pseudomallei]